MFYPDFEYDGIPGSMRLELEDKPIRMIIEETVHFNRDVPEGRREWFYNTLPPGSGTYVVGTQHRAMIIGLYHQLHCIDILSNALSPLNNENWSHVQHCLDYLRMISLCEPNLTLEAGDFTKRNFTEDRIGVEHVCRNWEVVYDAAAENNKKWQEVKR